MITLGLQEKNTFLEAVNEKSGANVLECYQCGKCVVNLILQTKNIFKTYIVKWKIYE